MGTSVESFTVIEDRIKTQCHNTSEDIQNDINALQWQREIYNHMLKSMMKSPVLRKSDL